MTSYLHLVDLARCHTLGAFSGMRFEDYRSHLRIRVGDGVHVMNIDERNQTKSYAGWMTVA